MSRTPRADPLAFAGCNPRSTSSRPTSASPARRRDCGPARAPWHDNFGHEEEERQQLALGRRLDEFVEMKDAAEIVDQRVAGEVDVRAQVTIEDRQTGERRRLVIGSYQVLDQHDENAIFLCGAGREPAARRDVGEEREVAIGEKRQPTR